MAGRFILATNIESHSEIPSPKILWNYKNQQSCERGFKFLKDPQFFAVLLDEGGDIAAALAGANAKIPLFLQFKTLFLIVNNQDIVNFMISLAATKYHK
ncbi:MAG: hypothetical protein AB4080_05225 [Trichodesmium sp.]